ncbi:MAG: spvB, partial [Geminicoccaceae bacterium]|nr:spvB [Geminicoccaceae bacterium]
DGLADIVYVDDRQVTLWLNQGGSRWSDPIVVRGTPAVVDTDAVRLVDLHGTGVGGLLWSRDAGGPARDHLFSLDFTGGAKPYLLADVDNRLGAVTRVTLRIGMEKEPG